MIRVHNLVRKALLAGRLTKQPCRDCGSRKTIAHHHDYTKPLDVIWLCHAHHSQEHGRLRREGIVLPGRDDAFDHNVLYIRVPDDLRDWIVTQATKENRTLSNMAAQLLAEARQHRLEKNHAA